MLFIYDDTLRKVGILHASLAFFVLQKQQNLGRILDTSKMHLSPPVALAAVVVVDSVLIVTPNVVFCNCSMFYLALIRVHSSFAIISMGKRELVA